MVMKAVVLSLMLNFLSFNFQQMFDFKNYENLNLPRNENDLTGSGSNCHCNGQVLENGSFESRNWVYGKSVPSSWIFSGDFTRRSNYVVCDQYNGFLVGAGSFYQDVSGVGEGDKIALSIWGGYHNFRNHYFKLIFLGEDGTQLGEVVQRLNRSVAETGGRLTQYWLEGVVPKGAAKVRVEGRATGDYFKVDAACLKIEKCSLPVNLLSVSVVPSESSVKVLWSTASENNSDKFEIEYSASGKKWEKAGSVPAHNESDEDKQYVYVHHNPKPGVNLYRLKMIDRDGTYAYSRIVETVFLGVGEISVFPNPANSFIELTGIEGFMQSINIYNLKGGMVMSIPAKQIDRFDVSGLAAGSYVLQVQTTNGKLIVKRLEIKK